MIEKFSPWHVDATYVEDADMRQRVVARAQEHYAGRDQRTKQISRRKHRVIRILLGISSILLIVVLVTGVRGNLWALLAPIAAIVALIGLWLTESWVSRRHFLRRALREFGDERCVGCRHPLRGLPRDVIFCPECGAVRVFEVRDETDRAVKL